MGEGEEGSSFSLFFFFLLFVLMCHLDPMAQQLSSCRLSSCRPRLLALPFPTPLSATLQEPLTESVSLPPRSCSPFIPPALCCHPELTACLEMSNERPWSHSPTLELLLPSFSTPSRAAAVCAKPCLLWFRSITKCTPHPRRHCSLKLAALAALDSPRCTSAVSAVAQAPLFLELLLWPPLLLSVGSAHSP